MGSSIRRSSTLLCVVAFLLKCVLGQAEENQVVLARGSTTVALEP